MVVVEDEDAPVVGILLTRDTCIPRAEITPGLVRPKRASRIANRFALPRAIVAVRRHDHPFTPQRMPSFFPKHGSNLLGLSPGNELARAVCRSSWVSFLDREVTRMNAWNIEHSDGQGGRSRRSALARGRSEAVTGARPMTPSRCARSTRR